jgi:hypothetical protein
MGFRIFFKEILNVLFESNGPEIARDFTPVSCIMFSQDKEK